MTKTNIKTTAKGKHAAAPRPERRGGSQELVHKLMSERTEMLALYCRLAGLDAGKHERRHAPAARLLQEFCQVMVDYLAAGHFSLYERLVNGDERRKNLAELAGQLYPRIAETTQAALDFNDKYDGKNGQELSMSFDDDLSRLGELLAGRIEVEDRLLKLLC
jgi:regulator of sigma D